MHRDREKNTFGIGAKVTVSADDGFKQLQELELVHGFQSSVEPCLIFGVGKRQWVSVKINWPDGKAQVLAHQAVNETILFDQKDAPDDTVKEKISLHYLRK